MPANDHQMPAFGAFMLERGKHGSHKRFPDGRKLSNAERQALPLIAELNAPLQVARDQIASIAHSRDVPWLIDQFLSPVALASKKRVKLPNWDLLLKAVAHIEGAFDAQNPTIAPAHTPDVPRKKLLAGLVNWAEATRTRASDPRWGDIDGQPVTHAQFVAWRASTARQELTVIPHLEVPAPFAHALEIVQAWDTVLADRGYVGEQFSLREEVVRLHNWPGDQWVDGDDYASAQKRFHRRLKKARKLADDPVRDAVMQRALYLREGLLLDGVDPLQWFLAVCKFRWSAPDMLDVRPEIFTWKLAEQLAHLAGAPGHDDQSASIDLSTLTVNDPRELGRGSLRAVSGPRIMIDLDEDVVTALPPGCRVRRFIVSGQSALGPDWTVYWVDSERGDARVILDLVESEKLHPNVIFVSDGQPDDLANLLRPFLEVAFEIPTNPLTAHSHIPGVMPLFPEHPDAGL
ncbi:MAG: hypothetical protein E7L06_00110 [Schaalia turicensis]|nr:hypothetical protein [Schaalia turicensis]